MQRGTRRSSSGDLEFLGGKRNVDDGSDSNLIFNENQTVTMDRHTRHFQTADSYKNTEQNPYNGERDVEGSKNSVIQSNGTSQSHHCTPYHQSLKAEDPAILALRYTLGHGVFLCAQCAEAHRSLGERITTVRNIQQYQTWSSDEAMLMKQAGGNTMGWKIYEAFLPETWRRRRPNHASQPAERLVFIRAKYEALAFAMPPIVGGRSCEDAWRRILARNEWASDLHHRDQVAGLQNLLSLVLNSTTRRRVLPYDKRNIQGAMVASHFVEPPQRLVDYFCVVGSSGLLDPQIMQRQQVDFSTLPGPEDVILEARVTDCFPSPKQHDDMEFPEHVATFVLPEGCCPSDSQKSPSFFTFVLTASSGDRLYGACLQLYDEAIEIHELREAMEKSGYTGGYPSWLPQSNRYQAYEDDGPDMNSPAGYDDIVYLPKCLVILSHYPFFDLFRYFLLQLYRVTLIEAPLPIERFIANFCCELPLPPQGKVEVKFGFTVKDTYHIRRPPENKLPLANFSYKPLFACLSVGNIIAVMGCLMTESRVALCSRHYALLGPVAEALFSFLFPFQWQGMYIPVMPYSMLDILDAPVPFLVGLHARYLVETRPEMRPHGVVFVDLDRDIVHLGVDEESNTARMLPSLPEKGALKLRAKLEEHGSQLYLAPDNIKHEGNTITHGYGDILSDSMRESYAATVLPFSFGERATSTATEESKREERPTKHRRQHALRTVDKAYQDNELLTPITGFLSEHGQLYNREPARHQLKTQKVTMGKLFNYRRSKGQSSFNEDDVVNPTNHSAEDAAHIALLDMEEPRGFYSGEIRKAFLRFFVSFFKGYEQFINVDANDIFRVDEFVASLGLPFNSSEFARHVVSTQMFNSFLHERQNDLPLYQFFDEQIIAKQNRSKRFRQKDTPFLDDPSGAIKETFTPPPPSNWGLPDDGRLYQYGCFPKLNPNLFGKIRPPIKWPKPRKSNSTRDFTNKAGKSFALMAKNWQQEIIARSAPTAVYWKSNLGIESLEAAMNALSHASIKKSVVVAKAKDFSPVRRKASFESLSLSFSPRATEKSKKTPDIVDLPAHSLADAESIVSNARRILGIMILEFVKLQAVVRMYLARKLYCQFLKALRFLQCKWKRHIPEGLTEMDELELARISVIHIQSLARAFLMTRSFKRKRLALSLIQRWSRGRICRKRFIHLQRACRRIQAIVQSRRARFGLQLLRELVSKVQARSRGYLIRHRMTALNERRMERYRELIFLLWHRAHTPLSYRTKFWPIISEKCGHLRLRIAESELERLWIVLEVDFNAKDFSRSRVDQKHAEELRLGQLLGITDHTYWRYLMVQEMTRSSMLLFPAEEKRRSELRLSADRVEAERIQIYERISTNSPTIAVMLVALYGLFKIDRKHKNKKYRLAELVCKFIWKAVWHSGTLFF